MSLMAESASESEIGRDDVAVYPSIECTSASIPVKDVISLGKVNVNSGSISATFAAIRGLPILILSSLSVSVITDQNVTWIIKNALE